MSGKEEMCGRASSFESALSSFFTPSRVRMDTQVSNLQILTAIRGGWHSFRWAVALNEYISSKCIGFNRKEAVGSFGVLALDGPLCGFRRYHPRQSTRALAG